MGHFALCQVQLPPPSEVAVSVYIRTTIDFAAGDHGKAAVAHEYAKSEMRLLSSLECICSAVVPFFIPILVGEGWFFFSKEYSVLRENTTEVEKPIFDFRPRCDRVLIETVGDGGALNNLQRFGRFQ